MDALAAPLSALGVHRGPGAARARPSLPTRASLRGRLGTAARGGVVDAGAFIAPRRAPRVPRRVPRATPPGSAPPLGVNDDGDDSAPPPPAPRAPEGPVPNPPLRLAAGLAAVGCAESSYLAFEKLVGGEAACPLSGCQTALSSSYSVLFGVPLSAYGALAYGLVAALAWWGANERRAIDDDADDAEDADASSRAKLVNRFARIRALFALSAAGLAGVSSYLLYVLAVPLGGAECVYCLTSAAISFSLLGVGVAGLSGKEAGRTAPAAVALYAVTALSLSLVLGSDDEAEAAAKDLVLAYKAPTIESASTAYSRDLAAFLGEKGAKMYGAFWCSHCEDQKETFGAGAPVPYVECFPDGWRRGTPLDAACASAEITGFPTWVLADGTRFEGEKSLAELARAAGFRAPPEGEGADAGDQLAAFMGTN